MSLLASSASASAGFSVDKPFRIAMVGLGGVAQAHLQALSVLDSVSLVAVCDVDHGVAAAHAKRYGARAYTDYQVLLSEQTALDLVMVLTPASTHRVIVETAARHGLHVFCEKPIAVTQADGEAMVQACERARGGAGVKLFYGSCYRYLPALVKAKALIQSGALGEVQLMTEQVIGGHGKDGYRELAPIHYPLGGPGGPGMGLVDHGVHLIDIFAWLNDAEIVAVHGKGQRSGAPAGSEWLVMQLSNGAMGHLLYNAATYSSFLPNEGMFSGGQGWQADASVAEAGGWENEPGSIAVYGSRGSLRIFHYTNALFLNQGQGMQRVTLTGRAAFGHFATQLEDCAAAIFEDRKPTVSGADGMKALAALLQVYDSGGTA